MGRHDDDRLRDRLLADGFDLWQGESSDQRLAVPALAARQLGRELSKLSQKSVARERFERKDATASTVCREISELLTLADFDEHVRAQKVPRWLVEFATAHGRTLAGLRDAAPGDTLGEAFDKADEAKDAARKEKSDDLSAVLGGLRHATTHKPGQAPEDFLAKHIVDERTPYPVEIVDPGATAAAWSEAKAGRISADRDRNQLVSGFLERLRDGGLVRPCAVPLAQDLDAMLEMLREVSPHMRELADAVRGPLAVAIATDCAPLFEPMLLVGPPGTGKTHAAQALADVLGVPSTVVQYAANTAGCTLSGTDRHWSNASAGAVASSLADSKYANPVIVLDELDKAGTVESNSRGTVRVVTELLPLLEPGTAAAFEDRCLGVRFNARHCVFVGTANQLGGLGDPLLSRMRLIQVRPPGVREAMALVDAIAASVLSQLGATDLVRKPSGEVRRVLAGMSPRLMRRTLQAAVGFVLSAGRRSLELSDLEAALGLAPDPTRSLH